jgi:hypothetical protein
MGNTRSAYGMGQNPKLFFTVSRKKSGTLELTATAYHIPVTAGYSTGNIFFINPSIDYDIPLSERIGIGATFRYWEFIRAV